MKSLYFNEQIKKIFLDKDEKDNYISLFSLHKNKIINIVCKNIEYFIQYDKNICNNQLKLIKRFDSYEQLPFYIGFKCTYYMSYLMMDLYLFASEPHLMVNGEFYLNFNSIIDYQKQLLRVHQSELHLSIQKLFRMTFETILKKYM